MRWSSGAVDILEELRKKVCDANRQLELQRLVLLTWGNVSAIDAERKTVAIKPSGVKYSDLTPGDIVLLDLQGNVVEGRLRQSSDTPTHLELYRRFPGAGSVIHIHSTYATAFAQAKKPVACLGTTHADTFYGEVPVTRELTRKETMEGYELNTGKVIAEHFEKHGIDPLDVPACLLPGHGPFVWGETVEKALYNAVALEAIARMNFVTLSISPRAGALSSHLMEKHHTRKHGKGAYYGQK